MRLLSDADSLDISSLGFVALAAGLWERFWALSILFREQIEAFPPSCSRSSVLLFFFNIAGAFITSLCPLGACCMCSSTLLATAS